MLNYQTVDFMAGQLADQYAKQKAAGFSYPNEEELPKFFRGQAAKLAANGVTSIYDIQQANGGIVNSATGEPIKDVVLRPTWQEDPEAFYFRKDVKLEERPGGFTRWGKDLSVKGQADYGLNFVDGVPVYTPFWKDTSTGMGTILLGGALIAGGLYGLSTLGGAAAGTAGTAGAGTGTAISGAGLTSAEMAALKGAGAYGSTAAPIVTATAIPATQLAYPSTQIGAGASVVPRSLQATLGELGVQTAATTAPATAAAGSFQAALPSLLSTTAASLPVLDTLRTANAVRNMLTQPTVQQQAGLLSGGGGQARGVDFSPLYQNTQVGLLPLAERYRRSLI